MIDLDEQDFHLLQVLSRTRNITHAADELYITQSSVSKRIRQMEKELGLTLMLRSRQGVQFTPAGEIVLAHVKSILQELETMKQELSLQTGRIAGTLRAGISINYAMYRLPDELADYNERYPAVTTQITTTSSQNVYAMLMANQINVGILRGEYSEWRGERILLAREHICAITSQKDRQTPLSGLPQISRPADDDMERMLAQWMRENHLQASPNRISVNSTATCMAMVERGLGWGIVPEICLGNFHGCVRPLYFTNGEPLTRSTFIMYTKQALELPQVRAFIQLIREHNKMRQEQREDS
ncbi:LysR family transcriptional regulator [Mitsuokella sp.]|uniref:LysR family transcriptional regulator n=1 Tax=Mitsuokella sp. TaxID=2049034 RepID=UPI0029E61C53|nr:LysR family transcriptional regulator [Mitsuokella sp.]MDD6382227.1 LysR family transcriptional regulator [Selenomonadaceae bacterium]MDY4475068.1 LysR family transcriptional regulator [Mitsuokella sp.]